MPTRSIALHGDALARITAAQQSAELHAKCRRERLAERCEQHVRRPDAEPCEVYRAVQRDDGLARAGRPCDAGGPVVFALDGGALRGVQEDRPLLPGVVERPLQFSRRPP